MRWGRSGIFIDLCKSSELIQGEFRMDLHEQDIRKQIGARGSSSGCRAASSCVQKKCRSRSGFECFAVVRQTLEKDRSASRDRRIAKQASSGTTAETFQKATQNARTNSLAWREGCGFFVRFVDRKTPRRSHPAKVQRRISSLPCLENPSSTAFTPQKPLRRAKQQNRDALQYWRFFGPTRAARTQLNVLRKSGRAGRYRQKYLIDRFFYVR
jgi:hypothetical protein